MSIAPPDSAEVLRSYASAVKVMFCVVGAWAVGWPLPRYLTRLG
jgi:hypothetical protein